MTYRIGLSANEVSEEMLKHSGFSWEKVNPRKKILSLAPQFIERPYKFGASVSGDSPNAFDCSSLTAYLYVQAGFSIPRVCNEQYRAGQEVSEAEAQPGDLVFFQGKRDDIPSDQVGHVGVYMGNGEMIQAGGISIGYGKVVREKITESKYYPTGFLGYRKLIPVEEERFVIEIPADRPDLRNKDALIAALNK